MLPELYHDLAQPGVKILGKVIGDALSLVVLPMTAMGTYASKVNMYLQHNLKKYAESLKKIPEEKVCAAHPQIAVPILQRLSYTTNEDIADLFVALLTKASNTDTQNMAHPGFESVISQLSQDEARIIKYLKGKENIEYCDLVGYNAKGDAYAPILRKMTMIPVEVKLDYPQQIHAYYDNLVRLGIMEDKIDMYLVDNGTYKKIQSTYMFKQMASQFSHAHSRIETKKSYYQITDFGKLFIKACTS